MLSEDIFIGFLSYLNKSETKNNFYSPYQNFYETNHK
jgi:hypothetical protein